MWKLIEMLRAECAHITRVLIQDDQRKKTKKDIHRIPPKDFVTFVKIDFYEYYPSLNLYFIYLIIFELSV